MEDHNERLTLQERIIDWKWQIWEMIQWRVRPIRCFLTSHNVVCDVPDWRYSYCNHCWRHDPNEDRTLWHILNSRYVSLVEHTRWMEKLDAWLDKHKLSKWLPSWWQY